MVLAHAGLTTLLCILRQWVHDEEVAFDCIASIQNMARVNSEAVLATLAAHFGLVVDAMRAHPACALLQQCASFLFFDSAWVSVGVG